jgi:hypothetical protein
MLYLFTGTHEERVRAKAFAWIEATKKKEPSVSYIRISPEQIRAQSLEEITNTQGLFFSKILVLLDDPFATAATTEQVVNVIETLAASSNPIALLAPGLTSVVEKKITPHITKVFKEDRVERKGVRGFNSALVNALGSKNGKALWKEVLKSKREGDAPEVLHGLLHWKARDMMAKGSKVWKPEEARALSIQLIELLSDSRKGDLNLFESLERFALSLK